MLTFKIKSRNENILMPYMHKAAAISERINNGT